MASRFAGDLKARGFSPLTHSAALQPAQKYFGHVVLGDDRSVPVYDHGNLYTLPVTVVMDETGELWMEDGHIDLAPLEFRRVAKP